MRVKLLIQVSLLWSQLESAKFVLLSNYRIGFDEEFGKDVRTDPFYSPRFGDGTSSISRNVNNLVYLG